MGVLIDWAPCLNLEEEGPGDWFCIDESISVSEERGNGGVVVLLEGSSVRGNTVSEERGRGCLVVLFTDSWVGGRSGWGE